MSVTGHCGPGLAFILQGTWWGFHAWRRYIRSRAQERPYVCRAWYPLHCVPRLACFEGVAKIVCCLIGLVIEYITAFEGGKLAYASHYHHVSMYFFSATSGVVEILMYKGLPLPEGSDYVATLLATVVVWLLFNFHLHGRSHLDVLAHSLLMYTAGAQALCTMVEMVRRHSILASLGRAYCSLLQGTWLCQAGFMLYSRTPSIPRWDEHSHSDVLVAGAAFTLHMWLLLLYIGLLGVLAWIQRCTCDCDDPSDGLDEAGYSLVYNSFASVDRKLGGQDKTANMAIGDYTDDDCHV
ncbi:transmembrane protein 45B-like [Haemaphysalis longicornis]